MAEEVYKPSDERILLSLKYKLKLMLIIIHYHTIIHCGNESVKVVVELVPFSREVRKNR